MTRVISGVAVILALAATGTIAITYYTDPALFEAPRTAEACDSATTAPPPACPADADDCCGTK